jgi:Fe-S-cluster containining protein
LYKVFKCTLCGECCKASPISLLPFEDSILRILAYKLNRPYHSKPGYLVYDERRGVNIALSYTMELVNGRCPFLTRNNLCMINNIYKPLICRSYPYVPKQVRYTISVDYKIIFATTDYGLSIKCPVIRDDREYIEELMRKNPLWPMIYMPNEYKAAMEMEEKRNLLLRLLSELWRRGLVELADKRVDAPVVNLYDILRRYYPNLPYVLGINNVYEKIRSIVK